ncbi:hypothetical protein CMU19_04415 [Elizabethkingia anophelis]|nr:hypothetical protein [Elizabethkingia anophelis]
MEDKRIPTNAREEAEELVKKYFDLLTFKSAYKNVKDTNSRAYPIFRTMSIECAIICVDKLFEEILEQHGIDYAHYWDMVKQELEKMK